MKHAFIRRLLDLSLYIALIIWGVISFTEMIGSSHVIQWQHYLGLLFLAVNGFVFYKSHQAGVLLLGITLLFGLFGVLSFNVGLANISFLWTPFGIKIPLFWGNPIFLVLLILHFIISGRYYTGILTKEYWETLEVVKSSPTKEVK